MASATGKLSLSLPNPFLFHLETIASALIGCGVSFVISHTSKGTTHVSTQKTNGIDAARENNHRYREGPHPWDRPYNSRCLISRCDSPVYYDGKCYFSLCLLHLQELQLGPFFKPHQDKTDDYDDDTFLY